MNTILYQIFIWMNKRIWYFGKFFNEWINEYDIIAFFLMNELMNTIFWQIFKRMNKWIWYFDKFLNEWIKTIFFVIDRWKSKFMGFDCIKINLVTYWMEGGEGMKIGNTRKRLFTVGGLVTKVELKLTSGSLNWQKYQSILFLWRKWYCRNVSPAFGICNHMYQGNLGPISQRYSGYKFPPTHPKYWIDNPGINFILTFNWRRLKSSYINTFYLS